MREVIVVNLIVYCEEVGIIKRGRQSAVQDYDDLDELSLVRYCTQVQAGRQHEFELSNRRNSSSSHFAKALVNGPISRSSLSSEMIHK